MVHLELPERGKFRGYVANLLRARWFNHEAVDCWYAKRSVSGNLGTTFHVGTRCPRHEGKWYEIVVVLLLTTFSPYGMVLKNLFLFSSSSSPSIHSSASSAPKQRKLSTSSSSSRVIQPVAPKPPVSAKSPEDLHLQRGKASSLSDAESKRLAEKLGSRKVETPTMRWSPGEKWSSARGKGNSIV